MLFDDFCDTNILEELFDENRSYNWLYIAYYYRWKIFFFHEYVILHILIYLYLYLIMLCTHHHQFNIANNNHNNAVINWLELLLLWFHFAPFILLFSFYYWLQQLANMSLCHQCLCAKCRLLTIDSHLHFKCHGWRCATELFWHTI